MKLENKSFIFIGFLILTVLGFSVLPQPVQAASFWDGFGTALQKIAVGFIDLYTIPWAIGLQIVQMVTGILPAVAGVLFRVALNLNDNIALTPASPGAGPNDMVVVGFGFTRDIANMLFILILAWVGLATILRLETYEVKKIIPKLIIIALLINFIPVITGVILDIASIITKIFADQSTDIGLYMFKLLPGVSMIQKGTASFTALIPGQGGISGMAVASLLGIVFNLVAFFMLGLYAIIFVIRIVAIWILIVLAPLAWLGYIIPNGKKWWGMWWKQFIQWAIIGIPLTFFLYLTTFVLSSSSFKCDIDNAAAFQQYGFLEGLLMGLVGEGILCKILPFFAGITMMLVGFILSITLAPSGADAVIKGAKKGGLATSKILATAGGKWGLQAAKSPYRAVKSGIQRYNFERSVGSTSGEAWGAAFREAGRVTRVSTTGTSTPSISKIRKDVGKTIKGAATTGLKTALGMKQKKKGKRTKPCDACGFGSRPGEVIGANAERCPRCGEVF